MRACVIHGAGDLRVEDIDASPVGEDEVEVAVELGGICGSDLHYFRHGGVGDFTLKQPMVLGHEIVGTVMRVGASVDGWRAGQRVAVNPSKPCTRCYGCTSGRYNLCNDMRFLGSAARMPHIQGGFKERHVARVDQLVALPDHLRSEVAVFAEPLAVAMHAISRAGSLLGKRVLVTGAGPIGALITAAARRAGAAHVVVTDLADEPLAIVGRSGATQTVNVATTKDLADLPAVDVTFEASGAPSALSMAFDATRRGGRVVMVGLLPPGTVPMLGNRMVTKELDVVGSFRFHEEFQWAVHALGDGLDVSALHSATFPLERAGEAFLLAGNRAEAMKVQLSFE
jgi:L-idonate 5-dehydrogenase